MSWKSLLAWATAPPLAAFWAATSLTGRRAAGAAAVGAALGAGAAAILYVVSTASVRPRRLGAAAFSAVVGATVAFGVNSLAAGPSGARPSTAGLIALLWCLAVAAVAEPLLLLGKRGAGTAIALVFCGASLLTPWWYPSFGTFVPESMVVINPWLASIGVCADIDWVRSPGLYPVLGAAYTPVPDALLAFGAWGSALAVGLGATFLVARFRGRKADSGDSP